MQYVVFDPTRILGSHGFAATERQARRMVQIQTKRGIPADWLPLDEYVQETRSALVATGEYEWTETGQIAAIR